MPRTSMHDLIFALPGATYPYEEQVRVSWDNGVHEFMLHVERGKLLTADRCREDNVDAVLDSFLAQLAPEE